MNEVKFSGIYHNRKIDEKGRFNLPPEFVRDIKIPIINLRLRSDLSKRHFLLGTDPNGELERRLILNTEEVLPNDLILKVKIGTQNRINLQSLREYFEKSCSILGYENHFRIYNTFDANEILKKEFEKKFIQ